MNIIKRNGEEVKFDKDKIIKAIHKANSDVSAIDRVTLAVIKDVADSVTGVCEGSTHALNVEEIQDLVEGSLVKRGYYALAKAYITYRFKRALIRKSNSTDDSILTLIECNNEEVKQENSNKNPTIVSVQRDYMAGEVSKDITKRFLIPESIVKAHEDGIIHFHDMDYFAQHMHNCCLVNLEDMLQNGTVISETMIEKPHSFSTACNIMTQIIAQVASSQYGGQSISLAHLAPFVNVSRKKIRAECLEEISLLEKSLGKEFSEDTLGTALDELVEKRLRIEITKGIQIIQYQVVTLMTTNGQAPFVTIFMNVNDLPEGQERQDLVLLIEEVLNQRIQGTKNEDGVFVTPAFPKLIYVLTENNVREGTEYFWLTELAAKCTAKRMVPDYVSEKVMKSIKQDNVFACMGCRSFLTVEDGVLKENGEHKFYGRFNQGVVTLNLVDVACTAKQIWDSYSDESKRKCDGTSLEELFWSVLNKRLELCHEALMVRHKRLEGTKASAAPILWQHGALARLKPDDTIDDLLHGGYSTLSLGYAGLYECTKCIKGVSHTVKEGTDFALRVMRRLNEACEQWRKEHDVAFSIYGTPLESTTYKFAKCLQKRFGLIPGVTDKNYVTNSYHVHVTEKIDAFSKLKFESQFQALSPGGAISYVEVPDMQDNLPAVIAVMQFIYDNIMYAELNTKSDYCSVCGYDGEILIVSDEDDKLVWECPNCKNRDQSKMNVARRTCGYIGSQFWNQGRTQEIRDRVLHL